jgi:Uma2 family endonuclease
MSLLRTADEIEYPESDGKPMGETDLHRDWMSRILDILRYRYRGQRVYVASNLLVYYQQGEPRKFVVPDDFVVKDCDPGRRRTYKIWEECKAPDVVFEVTSRSTRREDQVWKPQVYARVGVQEYFLYDPTADYLDPPLQGFRYKDGQYEPIQADETGALQCDQLDILLRLQADRLEMYDRRSGDLLTTEAEAANAARHTAEAARHTAEAARHTAEAARESAEAAREAAQLRAQAAEKRAAELEAEIQRLREELEGRSPDA